MSATASRIALNAPESVPGVQGDAPAVPEPAAVDSEGTRPLPRRDRGGRYAPRAVFPCCEACGWVLAEDLAARLYCANGKCGAHRKPVGVIAGVDAGTVTAEVLAPSWVGTTLESSIRDVALGRIAGHSAVTEELVAQWRRLNPERVNGKCEHYRKPVGMVPVVDAGTVTAEVLAVGT